MGIYLLREVIFHLLNNKKLKIITFILLCLLPTAINAELQKFKKDVDNSNMGKLDRIGKIACHDTCKATLLSAKNNCNSIIPENDVEKNFKIINSIILAKRAVERKKFTSEEINSIKAIANLCPFSDGPAVYSARVLMTRIDKVYLHYKNECERTNYLGGYNKWEGSEEEESILLDTSNTVLIYPNPTMDILNIAVKLEEGQTGSLEIYNLQDKKIIQHKLLGDQNIISTKQLNSGIYFYRIYIDNNLKKTDKLIIIK